MANQNDEAVRIRLRYPDLDTFVEKYAPNVTRGGIFLATRDPLPVGRVLRFEVLLRQGGPVLSGQGRVTWVKEFNPAEPHRPYGMGVQFLRVDPEARPVLDRLLRRKQSRPPAGEPAIGGGVPPGGDSGRFPDRPAVRAGDDPQDDAALRRTLERARVLSARTEDIEMLLGSEPDEPATLSQALDDLPRLLAGRRQTGTFRPVTDDMLPGQNSNKDEGR
jgi:molecular chaperone DnaK